MRLFYLPLLTVIGSLIGFAQNEVAVELSSCRSEYKTHDESEKPGFGVKLLITPSNGISLSETETLEHTLSLTDATGKKQQPSTARLVIIEEQQGKAYAEFTFKNRPTGAKVELDGSLKLTVAKDVQTHAPTQIPLITASSVVLRDATCQVIPAESNGAKGNREGDRIKRAEVTLKYPEHIEIVRIERQWAVDTDSELNDYTQKIQYKTTIENGTKSTTLSLVDVIETPSLQISTCAEKKDIELPVRFTLTLSEAIKLDIPATSH